MDIWGLTIAALRRWYVLLPLLAVSLYAAYALGSKSPAEYEVGGAAVVVAPPQELGSANPYGEDRAAEILVIRALSSSTSEAFARRGLSEDYEISFTSRSPILTMKVVADSEATALATGEALVEYLETTLADSQKELEIRKPFRATLSVLDEPDVVEPVVSGRLRITGAIAVLGVILSFTCAVLVDAVLTRRRRAAKVGAPASPEPDPSESTEGTSGQAKSHR